MIETENKKQETVYILKPYFNELLQSDLDEIIALAESANVKVLGYKTQKIKEVNPATYFGSGKLCEIKEYLEDNPADCIIFDGELSPSQTLNISAALNNVKVIDRTTLILDIFALNAKSSEGKLQVELAQLKYIYPRLKGKGANLSQQGGGIGTRGPGETQLETDRRHIRSRINHLESALKELETRRKLQKTRRNKNSVKTVALVGYTNTGKSTLLNRLTNSDTLVKNQLFATLDPTVRKLKLDNTEVVVIDTVGFVKNIPHNLIEAFKSTLESAIDADLILNVCDAKGDYITELETSNETLKELNAEGTIYTVVNKCDGIKDFSVYPTGSIFISALTGEGVDLLKKKINDFFDNKFKVLKIHVPYVDFDGFKHVRKQIIINETTYDDNGANYVASVPIEKFGLIKKYVIE